MVQRKTAHDGFGQEHERSLGLETMKRARPSKQTTPEKQRIVAKVTGGSPNYMKGTSSSEARKQSRGVQGCSDKTGKKLDSCSVDKKKSSSVRSSGGVLKMGVSQSFKRSLKNGQKEIEEAKERIEPVSKTEDILLTLVRKPCNQEECTKDWREFNLNPRESNYLPIFEKPSNEKVELKHQDMDERKNAEEWMIDYALQHTVNKLSLERKKKVALFVEAFETILPKEPSQAFTYERHLQACN